jgi:transcriptional regulator
MLRSLSPIALAALFGIGVGLAARPMMRAVIRRLVRRRRDGSSSIVYSPPYNSISREPFSEHPEPYLTFIRENSFGTLTLRSTSDQWKIVAIPFLIEHRGTDYYLQAHVARTNPIWKELDGNNVLLMFQSNTHAYVSPSMYSKQRDDEVPTYNYTMVVASGKATVLHDENKNRAIIERLVKTMEAANGTSWNFKSLNQKQANQMKEIVFFEVKMEKVEGKNMILGVCVFSPSLSLSLSLSLLFLFLFFNRM